MTSPSRATLALSLAAYAAPAAAHTFHGMDSGVTAGLAHPFLGPDHLLAMVAVGVWAAQMGGRALWAVPLSFVGAMLVGGALALAGLAPPHVEPVIAASVLALGLLIARRAAAGAVSGALLAASFAVFHGIAHFAELPPATPAATYALGFTFSTALLHALGVGAVIALRQRANVAGAPIALAGCWMLAQALL